MDNHAVFVNDYDMNGFTYLKNVNTLQLNRDICNGCAMCTVVCPHAVFIIKEKKASIQYKDFCMECGACAMNCPTGALTVRSGVGCATGILNGLLRKTKS